MPVDHRELMRVVATICENAHVMVTVQGSLKGAIVAGLTTAVGGIVLGPTGLAFGGILGGLTAAWVSQNKFKSLAEVIREDLTPQQRSMLANRIIHAFTDFQIWDLATILLPVLLQNPNKWQTVIQNVINFLQHEMGMKIVEN